MYNILVVDDEKIEREGIKFLIKKHGLPLNVEEAENGKKALSILQSRKVDILLTDIKMPFMDGLQLAASVRESNRSIKIIILSAYGEFDYAKRAIPLHIAHYILKPVEVREFLDAMNQVIGFCEEEEVGRLGQGKLQEIGPGESRLERKEADDFLLDTYAARKVIEEVLKLIHQEYRDDLGLQSLADKVYLTPNYLSRLFKKETGTSIVKYMTTYRLEKACELLRHTNMKIVDISNEVGYPNFSYFCSIFRNYYGTTPAKYREGDGA
ncbi:response regulator transcription factor [Paenibacillus eucommiae]|uniref:Two-component system response regulator YesN n=1 Tax=Paenibacillus eucommiae TaxID=1355755 RepID=A0ABS4IPE9_9BACL|nr:response regulator [Paenibacillus eucommiae]MBP1988796.1 two-component system response regulator YesN [Paenibacillus eucommiae]